MTATRYHALAALLAGIGLAGCAGTMQSAAHQGRSAQGDLYAADGGQPADIYRSWALFNELAHYGSVEGELRIADLYHWDRDEYRSAYYWYRKAAADGDPVAAANLWYMYETRSGRPEDNQEAMGYYQLAADSDAGQKQLFALETKLAIDSERHYPGAASGQGTAIIEFERSAEGKASEVRVYRSSGNADLDAAAVAAVQAASLPAIPSGLDGLHHFIISVRISPDIS